MDQTSPSFNEMQTLKRHFFAMRNGVIADVLRRGGSPFRIIFGLNLPQIVEIANQTRHTKELALRLWQNTSTRESMLIAPMLMPREEFDIDEARVWAAQVPAFEVADILCHRLLRHLPYADKLVGDFIAADSEMLRYTGVRLACNLQYTLPEVALKAKQTIEASAVNDAATKLAKTILFE